MITIAQLIKAQDKSRAARQAFLDCEPPSSDSESRAFNRLHRKSLTTDHAYVRCLEAYMAQQGMGKEVYAHIEAAREAQKRTMVAA